MGDRLDQLDYYTLLGVAKDAPVDEIRQAFHRFAIKYHPDRHVGTSPKRMARAAQIYRRGAEAYRVLLEPEARRSYDEGLKKGELRSSDEKEGTQKNKRSASGILQVNNPRARPFASKALAAIRKEDWKTAVLNLRIALQHDPDNPLLKVRLEKAEAEAKRKNKPET